MIDTTLIGVVNYIVTFVLVLLGIAIWDVVLKKRIFPKRFNNVAYVVDLSLKGDDETLDDFIERASEEDLGNYKLI